MTAPASPFMTARESAAFLRRSRAYLTAHADEIGCYREGGQLFFRLADLVAYRERSYVQPAGQQAAPVSLPGRAAVKRVALPTGLNPITKQPYRSAAR